jgi:hypothetical protein
MLEQERGSLAQQLWEVRRLAPTPNPCLPHHLFAIDISPNLALDEVLPPNQTCILKQQLWEVRRLAPHP